MLNKVIFYMNVYKQKKMYRFLLTKYLMKRLLKWAIGGIRTRRRNNVKLLFLYVLLFLVSL